jgi:hypothetical protein
MRLVLMTHQSSVAGGVAIIPPWRGGGNSSHQICPAVADHEEAGHGAYFSL